MKDSVVNVLEDFEKLAYKILMWILLIPKTIFKVTVDPEFVPDYVHKELSSGESSQFDEYISPIILYLGVTLIPIVVLYFIPPFGLVTVTSPREDSNLYEQVIYATDPSTGAETNAISAYQTQLYAEAVMKSDTNVKYHQVKWVVSECGTIDKDGYCAFDNYEWGEIHNEANGTAYLLESEDQVPTDSDWQQFFPISFVDRNTVDDYFYYEFQPGNYRINYTITNYNDPAETAPVEQYNSSVFLYVPEDTSTEDIQFYGSSSGDNKGSGEDTVASKLESGETVFQGLALLLPPLLIVMATSLFRKDETKFSGEDLKENFYIQCYYFVPLGLAFWGWIYADNFYTDDLPLNRLLLFVPFLLAIIWFIIVEVNAIARVIPSKSKWRAFLILAGCILFVVLIVYLNSSFTTNYDLARKYAIFAYPLLAAFLTGYIIYRQFDKRRKSKQEAAVQEVPPEQKQD